MTRVKRAFALLLTAAMMLTLLAGCGKIPDPSTWTITNGVLVVPDGVTKLSKQQIEKVSGHFTSVVLPASLTSIGDGAFEGNTALESVTFKTEAGSNDSTPAAGWINFASVAAAINAPIPDILAIPTSLGVQSSTWKNIAAATANGYATLNPTAGWMNFAVAAATNIRAARAAGRCTIGRRAFYGCTNLTTVIGWSHVTSIGASAFQNTDIHGTLDLSNVVSIGPSAFEGCTGIQGRLDLSSVISIGSDAFKGCIEITVVIVPSGADVDDNAFSADVTIQIGTDSNADEEEDNAATDPGDDDDTDDEVVPPSHSVDESAVETQLRNWLSGAGCSIELDTGFENDTASLTKQIAGAPSTYILPDAAQTEPFKALLADFRNLCLNFYKSYSSNVEAGDFMIPCVFPGDLTEAEVVSTIQGGSASSEGIQDSVDQIKDLGYTAYAICYADHVVSATDPTDSAWVVYLALYGVQDEVDGLTVERCADLEAYAIKVLNDNRITPLDNDTQTRFAIRAEKYARDIFNNDAAYGDLAKEWTQACADSVNADLTELHIISLLHKGTDPANEIRSETTKSLAHLTDLKLTLTDFQYFVRVYKVSNSEDHIYVLMGLLYEVPKTDNTP